MSTYSLSHLSDGSLLGNLSALVDRHRGITADLLAHVGEVDARKLYLPAAHPSMYSYCVGELRMSEDSACKRIRAARAARQFPAIFPALAQGRLNLSAVVMLAPYLTRENADELLATAALKSKSEIDQLLVWHFPRPELPTRIEAIPPSPSLVVAQVSPETLQSAPGRIEIPAMQPVGSVPVTARSSSGHQSAPGRIEPATPRPKLTPLSPQRFALQVTIGQGAYDKLRYAQCLLGHQIPAGEVALVLERGLDALIRELERAKFAATSRPRRGQRRSKASTRHIPSAVKRAVWERDQGRCTFVSKAGQRCPARSRLEFDHLDPVARGGESTVSGIRIRCRAHNQHAAECTFGAGFMDDKRQQARRAAAAKARARTDPAEQDPKNPSLPGAQSP